MNFLKNYAPSKQKYSLLGKALAISTFLTIMSQLPQIVDWGLSSRISQIVWIILFAYLAIVTKGHIHFQKLKFTMVIVFSYAMFSLIGTLINNSNYYKTSLFSAVFLSAFILLIGYNIGEHITSEDFKLCIKSYVASALILALDIYFTIFFRADLSAPGYLYLSKNSAAVILFTAFLAVLVYMWELKKSLSKLVALLIIFILLFVVIIMKTRAMIICLPVVALVCVIKSPLHRKVKLSIVFLCVAFLLLLMVEEFYNLFINQIFLDGRSDDLDSASSGRFDQWGNLFNNLKGNILIGNGRTEQESLILTALIQCGVPMGILIISYGAWPMLYAFNQFRKGMDNEKFLLFIVALVYFIDAIFEQLAPFAPGARCFFLWLILGIFMAKNERQYNQNIN